jgi:Pyruvate/2-oxoacid:ferredoxin oxidoreductase delta subunit
MGSKRYPKPLRGLNSKNTGLYSCKSYTCFLFRCLKSPGKKHVIGTITYTICSICQICFHYCPSLRISVIHLVPFHIHSFSNSSILIIILIFIVLTNICDGARMQWATLTSSVSIFVTLSSTCDHVAMCQSYSDTHQSVI